MGMEVARSEDARVVATAAGRAVETRANAEAEAVEKVRGVRGGG
jgi:hypothetical protein